MLLSVLMTSVMCLHSSLHEESILEHTNAKCHLCMFSSSCKLLCNIGIHLILKYSCQDISKARFNTKWHEAIALTVKLLIISAAQHMPQNRVSNTIMHACDIKYHEKCTLIMD
jgi:hypothetical protein